MRKGCIVRYAIVRYKETFYGSLFPYEIDHRLMRRTTAQKELKKLQDQDFANSAMYGLSKHIIYDPGHYSIDYYDIEK